MMQFSKRLVAKILGRVPLQKVLIFSVALQIIAAVGVVGYLSWKNGQRAVNDLSVKLQIQTSSRIYLQLENYLQLSHQLNRINANAIEQDFLKISDLPGLESFFLKQMQVFELVPYTALGLENGEYVGIERLTNGRLNVEVVDSTTRPRYFTYETNNQGKRGKLLQVTPFYDPRIRPWYRDAMEKGRASWSSIYVWFNQAEMAIDATLPVRGQKGNIVGVLDTPFKLSRISDYLRQLKISKSGQSFIIERSGLLVASSSDTKPFVVNQKQTRRIQLLESNNSLIKSTGIYLSQHFKSLDKIDNPMQLKFMLNKQQHFINILPFHDGYGIDWLIVVVVPEADFMEYVNKNTQITLILCIAALIVAMIIGTWTASWIIKPILQLNTAAKDIAQGNWDNTLKVERSDELGELAVSFNSMASQLQKSFVEMEELNIKLKEVNHTLESRVHERTAELKAVNEELEAFSYSVSHDLQAPLRKIDSFSQIILARYGDNLEESAKSYFDRLRSNTQRMSEIINDLLTLSRVNRNQMQVSLVNVSAIVKEITDNLQENQPERQVEWIIAPEVIINCDASLMKMVLENLLNNAWKFTSSQIYPRIEFNTILQEDGKVVYFIRDNGAGFDMTHVNQLFKAFARLHSTDEFPGTGIGLAIVQRVIKRHGGEIWAEGEIGGGATFYFTL